MAELADVAAELRTVVETWEEDPARLEEVRARRQLLQELGRKYGTDPGGGARLRRPGPRASWPSVEARERRSAELDAELAEAGSRRG